MAKTFLITGATGKQGGAVIDALLAASQNATILALTRNVQSKSSKALFLKAPDRIKLLEGDLQDCTAIFANAACIIHGVFCVSIPDMGFRADSQGEELRGKALVDAALTNGVQHFVFTSVDRHGSDSDLNVTDIPHFISKANIEKYLIGKSKGSQMSWTILRPTAFMDNIIPGFAGKIFPTAWRISLSPKKKKKLQLVSTKDIGHFGAQTLLNPEKYSERAISLAGDNLTFEEANAVFLKNIGHEIPQTYSFIGWFLLWAIKDVNLMFKFFEDVGYNADISALRQEHQSLMSFEDWLKTSAFASKDS
ncbi:hypothetical protein ONS95_010418 [Cadophora gregata]|uniref:uncharacterized protein n=1 Tax=Cadophora gregata TaxID=51156 RepID=UPI0026DC200C|nr:uncharacterized protein ONS95_010418 [Cadophora gregata]KAK0122157.1 hypothetical protein ONS95_010418 [Cadophora gregata]KAK0127639.1 hypothetical protein ONS96_007163 [Cadophora gregata f. sp. sojae]